MDPKDKQELMDSLKQSAYKISKKVEAEKDDFRIVISSSGIEQYYKNMPIITITAENLSTKALELINKNPEIAATTLLEQFAREFDVNSFEKKAASGMDIKTAANETLDEMTWQMVTQKQLDDQKVKLHPRTDEYPNTVTQKQLPEEGLRPGTYEITTEGQLRDERNTFYGAPRTAGDWKEEDRNIVTEGQLDKGAKEYSEVQANERGQIGAKFDGGPQKQVKQTGEKQLAELLKHHKWTEPLTTTEGKDQLGKQDGELSRITAEVAAKIIKESLDALGKTVVAAGVTPTDLSKIIAQLVSHESKYPVLASVIRDFANSDVSAIDRKIAKARHFGKVANAGTDWSDEIIADVAVRQLAKMSYSPNFIVEALVAMSEGDDFAGMINKAADEVLASADTVKTASSNTSIFKQVLAGETNKPTVSGNDDDGLYAYHGTVGEVAADVNDKDAFTKAATEFAKKQVLANTNKKVDLVSTDIDFNAEDGTFSVKFEDTLKVRAAARRELAKEAQMGGMGGMGSPGGDQMGNPAPPPGGGDMAAPPAGETLTQEPPLPEEEEGGSGEPQPPGTVCAACGSQDVDIDNGSIRCNNCGAEGTISVQMQWDKWPGTLDDTEEEDKGGFGLGNEEEAGLEDEQEAAAAEGGATMPNVPVGASVRVTPFMLEKLSAQNIKLGSVCPNCGSKETDSVKSKTAGQDSICWECGQEFRSTLKAIKGKRNSLEAQTLWIPKTAGTTGCSTCTRLHKAFAKSLGDYGMSWDQFDKLSMKDQAQVVLKMSQTGTLNIKEAMNAPLPINKFAASTKSLDKFPSASCKERIARRFGENATAMSGPCQGEKLADCVCNQLESLGVYSDGLAAKVASVQASSDPMINNPVETCVKMLANDGMGLKEACVACDGLRAAYASLEDLVIETIAQSASPFLKSKPMQMSPGGMMNKEVPGGSMGMPGAQMNPGKAAPKPMMAPGAPGAPGAKPMAAPAAAPMGAPAPMPAAPGAGGMAKGLDDPQSDPVADELGGDLGGEMSVSLGDEGMGMGMGDEMGGLGGGLDMGQTGSPDTVSLLMDIAQDFSQLAKALAGDIDPSMVDEGGLGEEGEEGEFGGEEGEEGEFGGEEGEEGEDLDDSLDVSDVTDDVVDDNDGDEGEGDFGGNDFGGEKEETDGGIPGVEDSDDGGLEKESKPCGKSCGGKKPMQQENPVASAEPAMTKEASSQEAKTSPEQKELDNLLFSMKRGTIKKSSEALDSIFDSLLKVAAKGKNEEKKVEYKSGGEGSKVKVTPAQDTKGIGTVSKGGKIGHEEPFSKGVNKKPDVPRGKALMGEEGEEMTVSETKDLPTVPHGSPLMDGEEHYKPEQGNVVDGNQGATKAASTKTAGCKCKCNKPGCDCTCKEGGPCKCTKPCGKKCSDSQKPTKKAQGAGLSEAPTAPAGVSGVKTRSTVPDDTFGDPVAPGESTFENSINTNDLASPVHQAIGTIDVEKLRAEGKSDGEIIDEVIKVLKQNRGEGFDAAGEPTEDVGLGTPEVPEAFPTTANKESNMKVAKVVNPRHKIYGKLVQKIASGEQNVSLTDGNTYQMSIDEKKNVILAQKIKEAQTVSPKSVKKLEDDKDINQSSGPGKGKVKEDKTHSLAVDEKKPSEGMSEPSVPEAPNGGRLQREHTVEKAKDGPEIPAGGGSNPEYDTVEKYAPEKLDETLGKDGGLGATAENHELAVKIAGKLLKANKITVDELPKTIDVLSKKTVAEILDTFEGSMKEAGTKEGIQKTANAVENLPPVVTNVLKPESGKNNLVSDIKSLFTLDKRNEDYDRYSQEREAKLWR